MHNELTNEELQAAVTCARNYPPGHGYSFFWHEDVIGVADAADMLGRTPDVAEYG